MVDESLNHKGVAVYIVAQGNFYRTQLRRIVVTLSTNRNAEMSF